MSNDDVVHDVFVNNYWLEFREGVMFFLPA